MVVEDSGYGLVGADPAVVLFVGRQLPLVAVWYCLSESQFARQYQCVHKFGGQLKLTVRQHSLLLLQVLQRQRLLNLLQTQLTP